MVGSRRLAWRSPRYSTACRAEVGPGADGSGERRRVPRTTICHGAVHGGRVFVMGRPSGSISSLQHQADTRPHVERSGRSRPRVCLTKGDGCCRRDRTTTYGSAGRHRYLFPRPGAMERGGAMADSDEPNSTYIIEGGHRRKAAPGPTGRSVPAVDSAVHCQRWARCGSRRARPGLRGRSCHSGHGRHGR